MIWAITYGIIWIGKYVMAHKIHFAIGIGSVVIIAMSVKLLLLIRNRKELVNVPIKNEEKDY